MSNQDLARRFVADRHWQWAAGMLDQTGYRLISKSSPEIWQLGAEACLGSLTGRPTLPDLSDPATIGCILALVRGAWTGCTARLTIYGDGSADVDIVRDSDIHMAYTSHGTPESSVAGILLEALEAAP